jgi:hypothetical protein
MGIVRTVGEITVLNVGTYYNFRVEWFTYLLEDDDANGGMSFEFKGLSSLENFV